MKLKFVPYFFILAMLYAFPVIAQDFPGFRTANYGGANGVFFNPASIADSRYKWDLNLISISTNVGNNQATYNVKNLGKIGSDSLLNMFIGNQDGTNAVASTSIQGPSLMFTLNRKSAMALTTRLRVQFNAMDLDGRLANQLLNSNVNSGENITINSNSYTFF